MSTWVGPAQVPEGSLEDEYGRLAGTSEFWGIVHRQAKSKAQKYFASHKHDWSDQYCWQEAEDVAHHVLVEFSQSDLGPYLLERRVSALVARAAGRRAADHLREKTRREARQTQAFFSQYALNVFKDEDTDEVVAEPYEPGQDAYAQLEEAEEIQLVRDSILMGHESWSEILQKFYLDQVPAAELQQEYHLGKSSFYERLAEARGALQDHLSTSAYV